MIAKDLKDGQWYDVRVVGVRKVQIGSKNSQALEVAVRFSDNSQAGVTLFLTPAALANTRARLEALGCTAGDLTGADWLRKLNARLADAEASVVADEQEKYGVRLSWIFPRGGGGGAREVEAGPSPFESEADEVPF